MEITTNKFNKDLEVCIIEQGSGKGRPRLRKKMVKITEVSSSIKQRYIEEFDDYIGFSTRLTLFRGVKEYYLQISGVSTNTKCPDKNKVISFSDPEEFAEIAGSEEDNRVFWSPLTESLIDSIFETEYLTEFEKDRWNNILYE